MGLGDLFIPMTKGNINHGSITEKINIMSRSRKKAITKDKGWMKYGYWRTYRRVTKSAIKKFFNYEKEAYDWLYEEMLFSEYVDELIDKGYNKEDAYIIANLETSYDYYLEPELKSPKEVINDWDYLDYTIKTEFYTKSDMWKFKDSQMYLDEEGHFKYLAKLRRK